MGERKTEKRGRSGEWCLSLDHCLKNQRHVQFANKQMRKWQAHTTDGSSFRCFMVGWRMRMSSLRTAGGVLQNCPDNRCAWIHSCGEWAKGTTLCASMLFNSMPSSRRGSEKSTGNWHRSKHSADTFWKHKPEIIVLVPGRNNNYHVSNCLHIISGE